MQVLEYTPQEFFGQPMEELAQFFSKVVRLEDEGKLKMDIMYMADEYGYNDDFAIASIFDATVGAYAKVGQIARVTKDGCLEEEDGQFICEIQAVGDTIVLLHIIPS